MRDWRSKTDKSVPTKYVENYFAKPKEFRGVATRYDKNGRQLYRGRDLATILIDSRRLCIGLSCLRLRGPIVT